MKILLLSRYSIAGSSTRYRSVAYLPYLRSKGHSITMAPLLDDQYIERLYLGQSTRITAIMSAFARRMKDLVGSKHYDLVWLEGEAFPWIPFWLESIFLRSKIPLAVDYDDALFHKYDLHSSGLVRIALRRKIDRIMAISSVVIAGNDYLAERALQAGAKNIEILPTSVDTDQYHLLPLPHHSTYIMGWIGSPSTAKHLNVIRQPLRVVCGDGDAQLITIGIRGPAMDGVTHEVIQPWSEQTDMEQMLKFDVGLMPLPDEPWERGKCGHKLIKYMSCGRPVVASPVGVNASIVDHGINGFLASSEKEWIQALREIRDDRGLRERMGMAARNKVEQSYSLNVNAPKLETIFRKTVNPESSQFTSD